MAPQSKSKKKELPRSQRRRKQRRELADAPPPSAAGDLSTNQLLPHVIAPLVIILLGIIAYANSFQGAFLFDDVLNITQRSSLWGEDAVNAILAKSDRPLTDITFALNIRNQGVLPGDDLNPIGFHTVNLLIHLISALLLFGVVRRTLLLPVFAGRFNSAAVWIALVIAAIWTVHPLQTQAITYIVQRAESLMALFYLLTLYCYIRGVTGAMHSWMWLGGSVLACAAGMASKSVMGSAPFLILLYDYCFLWRHFRHRFKARMLTILGLAATWIVLFRVGIAQEVLDPTRKRPGVAGLSFQTDQAGELTWLYYFLTQPGVLLHYLRLSIWPAPLVLDYKWPLVQSFAAAIIPLSILCLAGAATVWAVIKRLAVGFIPAAFFIVLAPTSSFIPIKDVAFEHRMYLPLAAVITLIVIGCSLLLTRLWNARNLPIQMRVLTAAVPLVIVVAALTAATHARNRDYQNPERMWRDVIAKAPFGAQPRALNNLATVLVENSKLPKNVQRKDEIDDEACSLYQQIVDLEPQAHELPMGVVYYNLANCFKRNGDPDSAIEFYARSVEIDPRYLRSYIMWGNTLSDQGAVRSAVEKYNAAIEIGSKSKKPLAALLVARASFNLGNQYQRLGLYYEAFDAFMTSGNKYPAEYTKGFLHAGQLAEANKDSDRAILAYRTLLRFVPNHPRANAAMKRLQPQTESP